MRPSSHPTPVAPGPNSAQRSASMWAMCSSTRRVRPSGPGPSRTSIQLTSPPYSHVAANPSGGSHRSIVPPALPSSW